MSGRRLISEQTAGHLARGLVDPGVVNRYRAKLATVPGYSCLFWTGAVSGRGHGRFWLAGDPTTTSHVVIAHRFGYGLLHGFDALMATEVIAHRCDNTLCQEPTHWIACTNSANRAQWAARRHTPTGALRDLRGARGRAVALRDAIRNGRPLADVVELGVRSGERNQLRLWEN